MPCGASRCVLLLGRIALKIPRIGNPSAGLRANRWEREASQAQLDLRRGKIDHPARGSKEVLDACAAVAFALAKDPIQRIESGATDRLMPALQSRVTGFGGRRNELDNYLTENDPLLRAFTGMN